MTVIKAGARYEVIAQVISIDHGIVHYQEVPSDTAFVPHEKALEKKLFDKRFSRQGSVYLGYFRIDGIHEQTQRVCVTPINRGGVPIAEELVLSLEECRGIFHEIGLAPSVR